MNNKTISKYDYYYLLCLKEEAKEHFKIIDKIVKEVEEITEDTNDEMFDFIWNGGRLRDYLKRMGIKVVKS